MSVHCIFGKKGSGKSSITKFLAAQFSNKIVFISPVERLKIFDYEVWDMEELLDTIPTMKAGEICVVKMAKAEALEAIACIAIIETDFTICIDEVEQYKYADNFSDMIHFCRHFDINIIANTRRYTGMPRLLTSQADCLYFAKTEEPMDCKYIQDYAGKDTLEAVKNLGEHQFFEYPEKRVIISPSSTKL